MHAATPQGEDSHDNTKERARSTLPPPAASAPDRGASEQHARRVGWPALRPLDYVFAAFTAGYVVWLAFPALPRGICFGDSGELQLAAATLGITHAPGYPGYVSLGYLATLVPGMDDPFAVTVACMLSGVVAILLCMLCQIRLGVSAPIASLVALTLLTHPRTWWSLQAPEVYFLSLALLGGCAYLLIRYGRTGRRIDLLMAALCFGVAMANRPPVALTLPFVIGGWWVAWRRVAGTAGGRRRSAWLGSLASATAAAALPGIYSLAYLYVRDTPETGYNYIENSHRESGAFPPISEGWEAKVERVILHTSGREFDYLMGNSLTGVLRKLKWIRNDFFLHRSGTLMLVVALCLVGMLLTGRRSPTGLWLLIGMIVSTVVFVCSYGVHGQAADLLPMSWAFTVVFGVGLSVAFPADGSRRRELLAIAGFVALMPLIHRSAVERISKNASADAEAYLEEMDMQTLPPDSVICVGWPAAPPVIYEKLFRCDRSDLRIHFASRVRWAETLGSDLDRPIFAASEVTRLPGFEVSRYRNIWRLTPVDETPADPGG